MVLHSAAPNSHHRLLGALKSIAMTGWDNTSQLAQQRETMLGYPTSREAERCLV